MRLFYAIFLPEDVRKALVEAQGLVARYRGWK
ncbi:MAG: RNA 2',3'-cyclic phosphodiesterase, partial [Thermus sp.]